MELGCDKCGATPATASFDAVDFSGGRTIGEVRIRCKEHQEPIRLNTECVANERMTFHIDMKKLIERIAGLLQGNIAASRKAISKQERARHDKNFDAFCDKIQAEVEAEELAHQHELRNMQRKVAAEKERVRDLQEQLAVLRLASSRRTAEILAGSEFV